MYYYKLKRMRVFDVYLVLICFPLTCRVSLSKDNIIFEIEKITYKSLTQTLLKRHFT
jgi:hypothetical protein